MVDTGVLRLDMNEEMKLHMADRDQQTAGFLAAFEQRLSKHTANTDAS
jgi:hypothetical protein